MKRRLHLRKPVVKAYGIFLVCVIAFYTLLRTSMMREFIAQPLAIAFTYMGKVALNLLFLKATASGTVLHVEGFTARIDDVCTGIFVVAIYFAAVLAYPCRTVEKLKGLLLGASVILSLNLIRVVSLMYIGRYFPSFFETAHLLVWQSVIIVAALLVWIGWTERVAGTSHL